MTITGYSQNGLSGIPQPIYNRFNTVNADVYHNRGNHSFRPGLDFRQQIRSIHAGNTDGTYNFTNTFFRKCDDSGGDKLYSAAAHGSDLARFILGMPTRY